MKKILFIPLLAMQLHALEIEHDGYIRVGYQTFNNESDTVDEKDMSIGGKFNLELIANENFRVGATLLSTNALIEPSGYGVPFYSTNLSSYTILAEAYLKANFSKTLLTIGRQELDTPYAQPDDVAMVPNRFEGVTLKSNEIEDTTLLLGYLTKWSGMDSAQDRAHFSKMNGDDGVWMANITYKGIENLKLQAWLYAMDNFATLTHFEADYTINFDSTLITLAAQYGIHDYDNGNESTVYGFKIEAKHDSGLSSKVAYMGVDGVAASNFFGGGPYYTNRRNIILVNGGDNAKAWLGNIAYDLSKIGINGVKVQLYYLNMQRELLDDINEIDIELDYRYSDNLSLQVTYSDIEDKQNNNNSFGNLRAYINYHF